MAVQRRRARQEPKSNGLAKLLRFAAVPAVVIVLIIIILCLDTEKDDGGKDVPVSAMSGESGQPDDSGQNSGEPLGEYDTTDNTEEGEEDGSSESEMIYAEPSQYPFQQDAVLELTGLVQAYCEAISSQAPASASIRFFKLVLVSHTHSPSNSQNLAACSASSQA